MLHDLGFDFRRTDAIPGALDDVVVAALEIDVTLVVHVAKVAGHAPFARGAPAIRSWTTAAPMRFLATTSTDCHADGDRYVGTCRYPGQWARGGTVRSCDGRRSSSPDLSNLGPRNGNRR